jgi:surface antigen
MNSLAYRVGCLAAHCEIGLAKTGAAAPLTTVGKGLAKLKGLVPKSTLGKAAVGGGLLGVGGGAHMLMDDRRQPGTQMEDPHIVPRGNPLLYEQRY